MVRDHVAGKPHEADIVTTKLFDAMAGTDATQIGTDKNLKHHTWMIRRTASRGIPKVKFPKVYLFDDTVNGPDRIVLEYKIA